MSFQRLTKDEARAEVERLVIAYRAQAPEIEKVTSAYTETEGRGEFIDPFLSALGWDVHNQSGVPQFEREVVLEHGGDEAGNSIGRPDYRLRVKNRDRMPVEAKKPSVRLAASPASALQARSYGWSLSLPAAVLTNFAELVIYDTKQTPQEGDGVDVAVIPGARFTVDDYLTRFDELWERLSYARIGGDAFYETYEYSEPPRGTSPFDVTFLDAFRRWRLVLAADVATNNPELGAREVGRRTQRILNALLFLRVCEDRDISRYEGLLKSSQAHTVIEAFREADGVFNAGLFTVLDQTVVGHDPLNRVIRELYWPRTKFAFGVLNPDILAAVYEQYLAERVELDGARNVTLAEKPELTHAGGVVPTPDFIVDALLEGSLGARLVPGQPVPADLSLLDPACGSGVFLVAALARLVATAVAGGAANSVSLLLAVLGDESVDIRSTRDLLPDLSTNIVSGNALVAEDFDQLVPAAASVPERRAAVAPLNLDTSLAPLVSGAGFSVIIGNPPYVRIQTLTEFLPDQLAYFQHPGSGFASSQAFNFDIYMLFIERALRLAAADGVVAMVVSHRFTNSLAGAPLRATLGPRLLRMVHFGEAQLFPERTTYPCLIFAASGPQVEPAVLELASDLNAWRDGHVTPDSMERELLTGGPWPIASAARVAIFDKMNGSAVARLGDPGWVTVFVGVQTSADALYFVQPDDTKSTPTNVAFTDKDGREWMIERAILRPAIQDRRLTPYDIDPEPDALAIFPYEIAEVAPGSSRKRATVFTPADMAANYPLALAYLSHHETVLRGRGGLNVVGGAFWAYGRSQSLTKLDDPKLVVQVLSLTPRYATDTKGLLVPGGGDGGPYYLLRPEPGCPLSLEVLAALLSHPAVDAYVASHGRAYRGSYIVHRKKFLVNLPVPALSDADIVAIEQSVAEVHTLTRRLRTETDTATTATIQARIAILRQSIEVIITAAFGLTTADMAVLVG